jgi:AcrR family transcriptional regulator
MMERTETAPVTTELSTRERLLAATIEAIEQGGEEAVHLRDIGATAGVTTPTIYHFFGSRAGLIVEAQAQRFKLGLNTFTPEVRRRMGSAKNAAELREAVRDLTTAIFSSERTPHRLTRLETLGSSVSRPALRERLGQRLRESNQAFGEFVEELQGRDIVRDDVDATTIAAFLQSLIFSRALVELDSADVDMDAWNRLAADAAVIALTAER